MSPTQPPVQPPTPSGLGRRGFLTGGAAVGAGALLSACTSNTREAPTGASAQVQSASSNNAKPGKAVTLGFSAPAADHGWILAISTYAREQAKTFEDVTLQAVEATNDVNVQISSVQSLIDRKVDAIVVLPFDGAALTDVAQQAMAAGIPVVNLDRIFSSPLAYRTWIGGDNYGMGVSAGNYVAERLKSSGVSNPVIAEVAGLDDLPLTQERSDGFKAALANHNFNVDRRVAAEFTVESGEEVTTQLLQAAPKIDAIWNHDDDQGVGVLAAIENAGRDEFFLVGGAGSANMMREIKDPQSVVEATVLYSPSMAADAISLARLIAQGRGMSDMVSPVVPASVTTFSATVTKDNVDQYMSLGFES
jgi:ribose transport system substrate-binding protein